jgi:hypothetical protein
MDSLESVDTFDCGWLTSLLIGATAPRPSWQDVYNARKAYSISKWLYKKFLVFYNSLKVPSLLVRTPVK